MDDSNYDARLLGLAVAALAEQGVERVPCSVIESTGPYFLAADGDNQAMLFVRIESRAFYVCGMLELPQRRKARAYNASRRVINVENEPIKPKPVIQRQRC